jgi:hypothetical protein
MDTKAPLSPEVWERTPIEAQEYIRALEARVDMVEAIGEQWVGSNKGTPSCIAFWKTLSYQEVTKFFGLQYLHKMRGK